MTRARRLTITSGVLALLLGLDHLTKWLAILYLKDERPVYSYLGDLFRLQYAENTGAFLSLGAGLPSGWREGLLIGLNGLILVGLLAYLVAGKHIAPLPMYALILIASGGAGNLIDRIFRDGRVVDFMNMGLNIGGYSLRTGIFNIADVAIMAGLFLIILNELASLRRQDTEETPKADQPPKKKH